LYLGFKATKNDPPDTSRWLTIFSTVGLAMPSFYIGSLLIIGLVFYVIWRGPDTDMPLPLSGFGWDMHLVLPVVALMARPTFQLAQVTSGVLSAELGKQYVIAGRSMGRTWRAIRMRFALKNVITPVILTIAGLQRFLVGELIMIEWLFRWPGLGRMLGWTLVPAEFTSSSGSPLFLNPAIMATILTLIAALFLLTDLVASIAVRYLDPRILDQGPEDKQS
jgi:peptide/nickel transport system permease protein